MLYFLKEGKLWVGLASWKQQSLSRFAVATIGQQASYKAPQVQ